MNFLHILIQLFSILAVYQNPWWRLKKKTKNKPTKSLGGGTQDQGSSLKISPGDSNMQPELRINVSNTKFFISVLLRGFTPSKTVGKKPALNAYELGNSYSVCVAPWFCLFPVLRSWRVTDSVLFTYLLTKWKDCFISPSFTR